MNRLGLFSPPHLTHQGASSNSAREMVIACFHCWPTILRASQQEALLLAKAILDLYQGAKGISFCVRFRLTHSAE